MKIIYGIQSTGNGHISRASEIIHYLKKSGHDVSCVFSGDGLSGFWEMSRFEPYEELQGFTFVVNNGKINHLKTAFKQNIFKAMKDIKDLNTNGVDLILSDFEPVSAYAAKNKGIPSLGISHQASFRYSIPKASGNFLGKLVTKIFAPTDAYLGLHWYHFEQSILPPIIDNSIIDSLRAPQKNKILVYLPFENLQTIKQLLSKFTSFNFHIYQKSESAHQDKNLTINTFSREKFIADLGDCGGVICQAGFELTSEVLYLGKKLLIKPVHGQYEQMSNVLGLEKISEYLNAQGFHHSGLQTMKTLDENIIQQWLEGIHNIRFDFPNVAKQIVDWIDSPNIYDLLQTKDKSVWKNNIQKEIKLLSTKIWANSKIIELESQQHIRDTKAVSQMI